MTLALVSSFRSETAKSRRARRPELLVQKAIEGMIPHNRLGRRIITKLKVYAGTAHPHESQQPVAVAAEAIV